MPQSVTTTQLSGCTVYIVLGRREVEVTSDRPGLQCWNSGLEGDNRA